MVRHIFSRSAAHAWVTATPLTQVTNVAIAAPISLGLSSSNNFRPLTETSIWFGHRRIIPYSAAGHPPLLRWSQGKVEGIESNGLIFGVLPDCDYPVCEISIATGDRFLLYTDGIIEPENAKGESFGEGRLEEVVRKRSVEHSF